MRDLGLISLYLSCAAALWAVYAGARGEAKARRVNLVSILTAGLSTLTLVFCFLTDDFRLAYVARNSARSLPVLYKISALWAGQSGSLLLWLLILSFYSFAVQRSRPLREGGLDLRVNAILGAVRAVFALLLLFVSSPFELLADPPYSGAGLNPMLQSLGMVVHPPLLFAGFSGFAVPFALAAAQLWPGDSSGRWLELARPWALTAWLFLTAGIVTGGQWAYSELGWGGYWAWDPVENASLLPWFTGTALVHTLLLGRGQPGGQWWGYLLSALTFVLTIFGTFLTRSGVLDSVHAFSGGVLGSIFLGVLGALAAFAAWLAWVRRTSLQGAGPGEERPAALASGIKLGNFLLLLLAGAVFAGTMFPVLSRVLVGREIVLDEGFFNQVTVPLFLPLLLLMGSAPLLTPHTAGFLGILRRAWFPALCGALTGLAVHFTLGGGAAPALALAVAAFGLVTHLGTLLRRKGPLKPGSILVHVGVLLMLIGIAGSSSYTDSLYVSVEPGDEVAFAGYILTYPGLRARYGADRYTVGTTLSISKNGREVGQLTAEKTLWENRSQPSTEVGIFSRLKEDLYLNLAGWQGQTVQLHLQRFALVSWIWFGSFVVYLGALGALLDKQVKVWQRRTF